MLAFILSVEPNLSSSPLFALLSKHGFSPKEWLGVRPASLDLSLYAYHNELHVKKFGRRITPTEYCCAIGHYHIWKKVCSLNMKALILEDDAIIDDFDELYVALSGWAVSGGDSIYYLGGMNDQHDKREKTILKTDACSAYINALGYLNRYFAGHLVRTVAYSITPKIARYLIELFEECPFVADRWDYILSFDDSLKIYYSEIVRHPISYVSSVEKISDAGYLEYSVVSQFPGIRHRVLGCLARKYAKYLSVFSSKYVLLPRAASRRSQ